MNRFDPNGHLQPDYATSTNSSDSNPFIVNLHLPNDIHVELLVPVRIALQKQHAKCHNYRLIAPALSYSSIVACRLRIVCTLVLICFFALPYLSLVPLTTFWPSRYHGMGALYFGQVLSPPEMHSCAGEPYLRTRYFYRCGWDGKACYQ